MGVEAAEGAGMGHTEASMPSLGGGECARTVTLSSALTWTGCTILTPCSLASEFAFSWAFAPFTKAALSASGKRTPRSLTWSPSSLVQVNPSLLSPGRGHQRDFCHKEALPV